MQRWIDRLFISQAVQNGRKHRKSSDEEIWRTVTEGNNKGKKYAIETETGEITKGLGGQLNGEKIEQSGGSASNTRKRKVTDVTQDYKAKATPGKGTLSYHPKFKAKNHATEIEVGKLVFNTFGGNIEQLPDSNVANVKLPDYLWNGKLWELKSPKGAKGTYDLVDSALHQIETNPGGIIIDCRKAEDWSEYEAKANERIARSAQFDVDVMYICNDGIRFLRYKKEE